MELLARLVEAGNGDAVAEDVMDPAQRGRLGPDGEAKALERLLHAVAGPQQHAVLAEADRPRIAVERLVPHLEQGHETTVIFSAARVMPV
ncbi:hypothetical protein D3C72_2413840 [compost metagenome]